MTNEEKLNEFRSYFTDFELKVEKHCADIKVYLFKHPDNNNLWQRWIFSNNNLIVLGDCYESIYSGGAFQDIGTAAECYIDYFNSKCVADSDGRSQSNFDSDNAIAWVYQSAIAYYQNDGVFDKDAPEEEKLQAIEEFIQKKLDDDWWELPRDFDGESEAIEWLREHGELIGGADWLDGCDLNKLNNHPFWHLAALKEAVKQFQNIKILNHATTP